MTGAWVLVISLIWNGAALTTVPGFENQAACERAAVKVRRELGAYATATATCVNLSRITTK